MKVKNTTGGQQYKKFSIDVMSLVGSQLLIAVIALFNSVVLARGLGVEDRGYFVMSMLLPSVLITFSDFGIGAASTKFVAAKRSLAPTVFVTVNVVNCMRLLLIGTLGIPIIHFYGDIFFTGIPKQFLYLGLVLAVSTAIQGWIFPIFLGLGKGIKYGLILLSSSAFSCFVLTTAWLTVGLTVNLTLVLTIASNLIIAVYIYFSVRSHIGEIGKFSKQYFKKAFRFGSGVYVSIVSNFANEKMVLLILNFFGGVVYVSLYTIAQALTERIHLVSDAIGQILMPKIAENPNYNSRILTIFVFKMTIIITVIVAGALMILAEWLVTFIYSEEFYGSIEIMRTLLIAVIFSSGWTVLSQDLIAREYTKETGVINVIVVATSLSLAIFLVPTMGLVGAAIASIIAYIFATICGVVLFVTKTDGMTASILLSFSAPEKAILKEALQRLSQRFKT